MAYLYAKGGSRQNWRDKIDSPIRKIMMEKTVWLAKEEMLMNTWLKYAKIQM